MTFSFDPFPNLITNRLSLRSLEDFDLEGLQAIRSDADVSKYLDRKHPQNKDEVELFYNRVKSGIAEGKNIYWVIVLKGSQKLLGTICLWNFSENGESGELGYELNTEFQGKGIMTEAISAVVVFGFETLKLKTIGANTHVENERSKRLLVQQGFILKSDISDEQNEKNLYFSLENKPV